MYMHLHSPSVPPVNVEVGGLGADGKIGLDALLLDDVLPAQPVAILLNHAAHKVNCNVPVEIQLLQYLARCYKGGHASFLVNGAAAMNVAILDLAPKGFEIPVFGQPHIHCIHVSVNGQYLFPVANPANHIAQPVNAHFVKPGLFHLPFQLLLNLFLAKAEGFDFHQLR